MIELNIAWNITAGTLEWRNVKIDHYDDGSQEETPVNMSKALTFTPNTSFTEVKHNYETITYMDQTVEVDIIQGKRDKQLVSTEYKIADVAITNLQP